MKYANSVKDLVLPLQALGFAGEVVALLQSRVCFQPLQFVLPYLFCKNGDTMQVELVIALRDDAYVCLYYDAVLRRKPDVPAVVINGVDVVELGALMAAVDWNETLISEENAATIDTVVTQLHLLDASVAGKVWSDQLRGYYWTPAGLSKVSYGIAQRFYFFDAKDVISFEEAYRYLSHRWMEKQFISQQKKVVVVAEEKVLKKKKPKRANE